MARHALASSEDRRSEVPVSPPHAGKRRLLRRLAAILAITISLLVLLAGAGALWVHHVLREAMPDTSGREALRGLFAPVAIERDALGVPTIAGASRRDVALATGFVHAQDRFFQMDLLRRASAGELSELLGPVTLRRDMAMRIHLFRRQARRVLAASPPDIRELLAAYAEGVNAGLAALESPPFEYLALLSKPHPWRPEDSVLVLYSMFAQLADIDAAEERRLSLMYNRLPEGLFHFLNPQGSEWEAPIAGVAPAPAPPPGPEVIDLRRMAHATLEVPALAAGEAGWKAPRRGASNSWAVAGRLTATGAPLLANELHLGLSVPNIWYRISLSWPRADGAGRHVVTGVSLPGAPMIVVGSNGRFAWGLTNSMLDTSDLVLLEPVSGRSDNYLTPQGPRRFVRHREAMKVKGEPDRRLDVKWTIWGPVLPEPATGRPWAVRAVVDLPGGADFEILRLELAERLEQALDIANRSGLPALNFLAADSTGRIGWTIAGRLPRRAGLDGAVATSWADGKRRWEGLLPSAEVPRVVDPPSGRLWTANNLVLAGEAAVRLPRGQFSLGARARQIRDDLFALTRATVDDMRRVQLDDRAVFLERWHDLLLEVLTPEALAADPRRRQLRELVERWGGRASVDSVGYRMVRAYRITLAPDVFEPLTAACREVDPEFRYLGDSHQYEAALWQLVTLRPLHLLNPKYKRWDEQLLAAADEVIAYYAPQGPLAERQWGEVNTTAIIHPMSGSLPILGPLLAMPSRQLPGDENMPRVQRPDFGASLRLVISPGREQEAIFQMPGGQSGNPISSHYDDSYDQWTRGAAAPFLPGRPVSRLLLVPGG